MKKQLSFLLAALMLTATLASCGGDEGTTAETGAVDTAASTTDVVVETEPVTTEEVTTVPVETEPPMVEVFTPVYEEFFDGEASNWKNNAQIKAFKLENGCITGICTGGDPSFCNKNDFDLDCSTINAIKIRYMNCTPSDAFQIFFTTDTVGEYNEGASFKAFADFCYSELDATDEWNELVIYTAECADWAGTLKDMRIDIANGEGAFFVDSIGFYTVTLEPAS